MSNRSLYYQLKLNMKNINKNNKRNKKIKRNGYSLAPQSSYSSKQLVLRTGIDPHLYATLKYCDTFTFSVATLTGTQQVMRLNSLFDPDVTGAGHQPLYFDQYAALYNRYRVLKTWVKVTFHTTTGTYNGCVLPLNGSLVSTIATLTTYNTAIEQPLARWCVVPGSGALPKTIIFEIALNDLNGCTEIEYLGDDRFEAAIGANPTELMQLYIGIYNPTAATVGPNVSLEMHYEVDFHDPISIGGS
jgi:hypothetical protein